MTDAPSQVGAGREVLVVGAGLAGSLIAVEMARLGFRVRVVERRPDPRAKGFIGGRSINLALSARGIAALERVGLAQAVLADAVPMPGRILHSADANEPTTFQPYSKNPNDAINSVSRAGLNLSLLEAADAHENVTLEFGWRCIDVDLETPSATFENEAEEVRHVRADLIIGADGAFSAVRSELQRQERFSYSQDYLDHGYKELHIPPAAEIPGLDVTRHDGFAMDPGGLHIWPRTSAMMIALPNPDRSFTCTLFWPFHGAHGFDAIDPNDERSILKHFERWYPDAVPLMPTLVEDYRRNPTSALVTIRCGPWHHDGKVVLLGDAAHAIVPFYGQGMNAAFEDCSALAQAIQANSGDLARAIPAFYEQRKPNADAIADMALHNFVEMRDKVGSRLFLMGKKLEKTLHRLMPGAFTPLYNMISFSTIPYAEARRRARRQRHAIEIVAVILLGLVLLALTNAAVLGVFFAHILLPLLATIFFYFAVVRRL